MAHVSRYMDSAERTTNSSFLRRYAERVVEARMGALERDMEFARELRDDAFFGQYVPRIEEVYRLLKERETESVRNKAQGLYDEIKSNASAQLKLRMPIAVF